MKNTVTTRDVAASLGQLHTSFRNRTYRDGSKVIFLTITKATWADLGRHSLLARADEYIPMPELIRHVQHIVPGASCTSGGVGGGTFRLPDYVTYAHSAGVRIRSTPHYLSRLYRFAIRITRKNGTIHRHVQKDRGSASPHGSLTKAFAALAQLLAPGDADFTIGVINRGTQAIVLETPVIDLTEQPINPKDSTL